jgi:hypothetical protein
MPPHLVLWVALSFCGDCTEEPAEWNLQALAQLRTRVWWGVLRSTPGIEVLQGNRRGSA